MGAQANLKTDDETARSRHVRTWRTPIYAIVRAGGKQYRVEPDQTLDVDRIKADVGSTVDLGVLLVGGNGNVSIGTPEVDKARVVAEIIEHGRDRKILVFKYKNKTRYRRRHGHRQDYTRLQIKEIVTEAGSFTAAGEKPKRAAPKRRRKSKAKPVAEETPTIEAAPEAGAPAAEAPAETEAKPKRARRTTAKKQTTAKKPAAKKTTPAKKRSTARRPRKAAPKAEADEPKAEEAPQPALEAEEPKAEEAPQPAPEAEGPKAEEAPQPAPEAEEPKAEPPEETE